MTSLRPISEAEYSAWLSVVVPGYAQDKVDAGQWPPESSLDLARKEYAGLLPQGKDTPNNHLYSVLGKGGAVVGTLWFVAKERAGSQIAYVYDIYIAPEHRRNGYAYQAFLDVESEVARLQLTGIALHVFGHNHAARALYEKLGYAPTNINMVKSVAAN